MGTLNGLAVTVMGASERHGRGPVRAFAVVLFLVVIAVVVIAALFVMRWWRKGPSRRAAGVLAERYARGEIDEAEYRERLNVLRA